MSKVVARCIGMEEHTITPPSSPAKKFRLLSSGRSHRTGSAPNDDTTEPTPLPAVRISNLDPAEVKRCTGFADVYMLLRFSLIVCNGDLDLMAATTSISLTWFEEWFLYFEFTWGRRTLRL